MCTIRFCAARRHFNHGTTVPFGPRERSWLQETAKQTPNEAFSLLAEFEFSADMHSVDYMAESFLHNKCNGRAGIMGEASSSCDI